MKRVMMTESRTDCRAQLHLTTRAPTPPSVAITSPPDQFATDAAGHTAIATVTVHLDKTPPSVALVPADGATLTNARAPFTALCSDGLSGLDLATLQILLDGADVTAHFNLSPSQATWTPGGSLSVGDHTWQVTVADAAGHVVVASAHSIFRPSRL